MLPLVVEIQGHVGASVYLAQKQQQMAATTSTSFNQLPKQHYNETGKVNDILEKD